jgi:hypothetical protein
MVASLYLFLGGVAVGAGTGSAVAALAGGMVGLLLGLAVYAGGWVRAHLRESAPVAERHSVMCFPYAQAADCDFLGDLKHRRWYDVARCSLMRVPTEVACDKGCIRMLNLARVRPGDGCSCGALGSASDASSTVALQA